MSPEQLAGKRGHASSSDLYALGLVLYELFTGERAYQRGVDGRICCSLREQSTPPASPSTLVDGLDPAGRKRVILRCLEKPTRARPPHLDALAVSAALPGGDPLAAALAAGETPSPEMIAAAGDVGALKPGIAATLLAVTLVGLLSIIATHESSFLAAQLDLPLPPDALRFKAREIIKDAGYPDTPVDRAHGFVLDQDRMQYARDNEGAGGNWDPLIEQHPGPVRFWYRESPRYMSPINFQGMAVTEMDPVPIIAGMVNLRLDPQGRLIRLMAIPAPPPDPDSPDFHPSVTTLPPTEPDWASLFEHAGLELELDDPNRTGVAPARLLRHAGRVDPEVSRTSPASRCASRPAPTATDPCTSNSRCPGRRRNRPHLPGRRCSPMSFLSCSCCSCSAALSCWRAKTCASAVAIVAGRSGFSCSCSF